MDVKPGYKQTEVGVIPEDWSSTSLGNITTSIGDGLRGTPVYSASGNWFFINGNNLVNGKIAISDETQTVDHSEYLKHKKPLTHRSILISINGTIGNLALFNGEPVLLGKSAAYLNLRSGFCRGFLYQALQARTVVQQFFGGLTGSTIGNLGLATIRETLIPIPAVEKEQRAIATALSDVDALIAKLDQVIAKKRDLKQAAMQELLTGRRRLPGFQGEWRIRRVGELSEIVSGGTPKTAEPSYWDGRIKWCTPTDITGCTEKYLTETERTISDAGLANSGARLLPPGALLLCSRATIGEIRISTVEICTNQGFKSLICKPDVSNEFFYYRLLTMKQQMVERAFGSTFLEISKANVSALELAVPAIDEQSAIATVLSDMDTEIAALETRLDKTKLLKQGMMQELLTGRIRLV